jgi:PPK2 family polyphosphate:nucleotide phosphotransferase
VQFLITGRPFTDKLFYIQPMKQVDISSYKAQTGLKLLEHSTLENLESSEKELKVVLRDIRKDLGDFQNTLYAHGKYAVLICLQGMDTSGKDSLIREVFKDCNASGVEVHSFKVPTELERDHDYIWRHYIALPAKGKFGVFNRTHYENVLVTRVHPGYILGENIPGISEITDIDQKFWDGRFEQINNFERHIAENGTIVFKFFLHLSKEEQRQRLLRRLRLQKKNWKFSPGDLKERKLWDRYQECYEEAMNRTSRAHAPWYLIPADNKKAARVIVASILLQELQKYGDIKEPELDDEIKVNIEIYRSQLEKEKE